VQRPLPLGPGYGYRARVATGATDEIDGTAQGQTGFGRYEASAMRISGQTTTSVSAAGGVVALGGNVYATRPVQQSFGVIHVPGAAGVRGYLNNQEVGRTDENGDLLVPELIPYYGNRLAIADEDLPLDFRVGKTEVLLAPPLRGGAVAHFDIERVKIVVGSVGLDVGSGRVVSPSFGQMTVRIGLANTSSPLGRGGEFYFENLRPGRFAAEVDSATGSCRFELEVPAGENAFVDLGRVRCAGQAAAPLPPGPVAPLAPVAAPPGDPPAAGVPDDGDPPATVTDGNARAKHAGKKRARGRNK
jgi:outer membrane usher protein